MTSVPVLTQPSAPQTILFIHSSDELYGADIILYNLIKGLDWSQFSPVVVLPTDVSYDGRLSALLKELDVPTYHIKMGVLRRMYFRTWRFILFFIYTLLGIWHLNRIIRKHNVKLIHSNTSAVINGAIVARLHNIPNLWHLHEILVKPKWFAYRLNRFILRNSDKIICVSHEVANHFIQTTRPTDKIQVIWNGIDTSKFSAQIDGSQWHKQWDTHSEDSVFVGIIGRISEMKGQALFLEAAYLLSKKSEHVQFFIIGSPIPQSNFLLVNLQQRTVELAMQNIVHFIPFASNIPEIMQGLDIIVVPSTQPDPLPTVVLEGMASARPVIAAAHGGALEMIVPDATGLLVEPNAPNVLADAMFQLTRDVKLRQEMGLAGRQRIEEYFSVERFVQDFNQLYESILQ